jgi:pantoate kinase
MDTDSYVKAALTSQGNVDTMGVVKKAKVDRLAEYIAGQLEDLLSTPHSRDRVRKAKHVYEQALLLAHYTVYEARDHDMSWAAIGEVYECTRQAAQQRFGGA